MISDSYGTLAMGRMGAIVSDAGTFGFYAGAVNPFGTGWSAVGGQGIGSKLFATNDTRYDNTITYKSPKFAGLTLVAQASLAKDSKAGEDEGTHLADRYYAVGLGADYGALKGALTFSMQDYAGISGRKNGDVDTPVKDGEYNDSDGYAVTAFGAYDFGVTKVSLGAQYFDNVAQTRGSVVSTFDGKTGTDKWGKVDFGLTGYGVILGAITPIAGGNLYTSLGYADYEAADLPDVHDADVKKSDHKVYGVGVGYQYPLSKRTYVYTAASYTQQTKNAGGATDKDVDTKTTEVMMGLVHSF